jgi:hypothetical protein
MMSQPSAPDTGDADQPDTGPSTPPDTGTPPPPDTGTTDLAAEVDKWKTLAQKHEGRAKANADAARELERVRREAMSDQERAVAEAVDAAKAATAAEVIARLGTSLVRAEIRAAAAGRLSDDQLDTVTAQLNVAGFLAEDGQVDRAAVTRFVDALVPAPTEPPSPPGFPDLGQGARSTGGAPPLNGDPLLRDLKATLGIGP